MTCFKCYSSSHPSCVGPNVPSPYVCPLCINPNSQVFVLKKVKETRLENGKEVSNEEYRIIDKKAAKILLAAAKIASISMNKAAIAAREEAVRRAKEAAIARKRAKEALEHVAYLEAKEKARKKDFAAAAQLSRPGGSAAGGSMGVVLERRDNLNHMGSHISGRGGNLNGSVRGVGWAGEERQRLANLGRVGMTSDERHRLANLGRGDSSNEVLAALNAVELREGNKRAEAKVEKPVLASGKPSNDAVPMDVEANPGLVDGEAILDDHSGGRHERSAILDRMQSHVGQGQNLSNRSVTTPPGEVPVKNRDSNQTGKQIDNGSGQGQGTS